MLVFVILSHVTLHFLKNTVKVIYDVLHHKFGWGYMINIGNRIKELREERDVTQTELAKEVNIRPESINRMEKGKYNPSYKVLYDICHTLGVTMSEFFSEESDKLSLELRQLLETAKHLTKEEKVKLNDLLKTMKNIR